MWARKARRTDQKDLQGCSTVRLTLPVGDERTGWNVQDGTFRGEWQCSVHCHSGVSVPCWNARGRVAVRPERSGASGSATGTLERPCLRAARYLSLALPFLEQVQHATHQTLKVTRIASGNFEHRLVRGIGIPRLIGRERESQHVHPQGMGHDDLVHSGHAHV